MSDVIELERSILVVEDVVGGDGESYNSNAIAQHLLTTQQFGDVTFTIHKAELVGLNSISTAGISFPPAAGPLHLRLPDCPPNESEASSVFFFSWGDDTDSICEFREGLIRQATSVVDGDNEPSPSVRSNRGGYHSIERPLFRIVDSLGDGPNSDPTVENVGPPSPLHKLGPTISNAIQSLPSLPPTPTLPIDRPSSVPPPLGSLLLRTQRRRFAHDYSYFAIPPNPKGMVIFPGFMPHAVMPTNPSSACASTPRVSIAMNIDVVESELTTKAKVYKVSGWFNVNREGHFNALHDHSEFKYAAVLYL